MFFKKKTAIQKLRERPDWYVRELPEEIFVPALDGHRPDDMTIALEDATLDDLAFAIVGIEAQVAQMLGDAPVQAGVAPGNAVSGEWVLTIPGPDDQPVDIPMTLKQEGHRLTGRIVRGREAGKFLEVTDGKVQGDTLTWTMRRDRPDGSTMVYAMSGRLVDGKIEGKSETTMDGNTVSRAWTARRK